MHKVIGYDDNGHKIWSSNEPGGHAIAPLIVGVIRTRVAGYTGSSRLRDMESIRSLHPTSLERKVGRPVR